MFVLTEYLDKLSCWLAPVAGAGGGGGVTGVLVVFLAGLFIRDIKAAQRLLL